MAGDRKTIGEMSALTSADRVPDEITLRPLSRADFDLLVDWINAPHVARWWEGNTDLAAVTAKYESRLEPDSTTKVYVIQHHNKPIGMAQCYRHKDYPEWDRDVGVTSAAGIDYMIGESSAVGKSLGALAIRAITAFAFKLFDDIECVVAVPQKANISSCRALKKAGFNLIDERKLESNSPSDSGISSIYTVCRTKCFE